MTQDNFHPDLLLHSGAAVEVRTRRDPSGANVVSEIRVRFPRDKEIPLGGITSNVLREIPLSYLTNEAHSPKRHLDLSEAEEDVLLHLLRNYPSSPGRVPVEAIYPAATAYFYEKFLGEQPYLPNVALGNALGVPVRTISTRVSKARSLGYLQTGTTTRVGGRARGALTANAVDVVERYLKEQQDEH